MINEAIIQFIKQQYEDFVPLWKWNLPSEIKSKNEKLLHHQILTVCRVSQYILAVVALLFALTFERSRQLFYSAAARDGVLLLLMELSCYLFLGYFMGVKRFPANYISLVILKSFTVLEKSIRPKVQDFELKVVQHSRLHGQWSLLSYNPDSNSQVTPVESQVRNISLMFMMIGIVWIISRFPSIDVSRSEKCALISTTLGSSTAAMLLVSTFAFDDYPSIKEFHKKCCEIWTLFAVSTFVFTLVFLLQRYRLLLAKKLRPSQNLKLQWECVLFMLAVYITIRYIPVIHKGFSVREVITHKSHHLVRSLIPEVVRGFADLAWNYIYAVGETTATLSSGIFGK